MIITEVDIRTEFLEFGIDIKNEEILSKISHLCQQHGVDAGNFTETWLAFSTNNHLDNQPTIELLKRLEKEEFNKKKSRNFAAASLRVYDASTIDEYIGDVDQLLESYGTPEIHEATRKRQRTPITTPKNKKLNSPDVVDSPYINVTTPSSATKWAASTKYLSRTNSGEVVCDFGTTKTIDWKAEKSSLCSVKVYEEQTLVESYKYMFERLRANSRRLNSAIEKMEDLFKEKHQLEEISHVCMPSAATVEVVGRICCDGNGKLNGSSLLLEGSHKTSAGMSVKLNVDQLPSYSFFPGQIVALSGINNVGETFVAQKLYDKSLPSLPKSKISLADGESLHAFVTAGPYMTADSMSYEPLEDFLKVVQEFRPHICFLIGPFVDAKHEDIEKGNFPQTYDAIFTGCLNIIGSIAEDCVSTKFIIIPSVRDIHHNCIYPTPPYSVPVQFEKHENLHFMSDPSMLDINGLIVGVTSTDVLFDLGKEEVSFPHGMHDRMGRLVTHLISQQSFYPLYPPFEDLPINWSKFYDCVKIPVMPHILILPSDLNCFVKDISGCCCLNPQRLTRGVGGGTYARIDISTDDVKPECSLVPNITCQVVRI